MAFVVSVLFWIGVIAAAVARLFTDRHTACTIGVCVAALAFYLFICFFCSVVSTPTTTPPRTQGLPSAVTTPTTVPAAPATVSSPRPRKPALPPFKDLPLLTREETLWEWGDWRYAPISVTRRRKLHLAFQSDGPAKAALIAADQLPMYANRLPYDAELLVRSHEEEDDEAVVGPGEYFLVVQNLTPGPNRFRLRLSY